LVVERSVSVAPLPLCLSFVSPPVPQWPQDYRVQTHE
jgi:hypothetical protein